MPKQIGTQMVHVVVNCMIPHETPERFARAIEGLCNILEERTVIYNFHVIDSPEALTASVKSGLTKKPLESEAEVNQGVLQPGGN